MKNLFLSWILGVIIIVAWIKIENMGLMVVHHARQYVAIEKNNDWFKQSIDLMREHKKLHTQKFQKERDFFFFHQRNETSLKLKWVTTNDRAKMVMQYIYICIHTYTCLYQRIN